MTVYPTDLSDSQWQVIKTYLFDGRKRKHSLRHIFNAILYLVKRGCQWRMLPLDFLSGSWCTSTSASGKETAPWSKYSFNWWTK